ncbi:MAG TPA: uL22 family ribosomal protein, partial [Gemmatimonadaceae bacterium]
MPAKKSTAKKAGGAGASAAKKASGTTAAKRPAAKRVRAASAPAVSARALMRGTRQSPYKMRLVIDQIRGKNVNEALALLTFSKKHAAVQISKTLKSAVANAEQA